MLLSLPIELIDLITDDGKVRGLLRETAKCFGRFPPVTEVVVERYACGSVGIILGSYHVANSSWNHSMETLSIVFRKQIDTYPGWVRPRYIIQYRSTGSSLILRERETGYSHKIKEWIGSQIMEIAVDETRSYIFFIKRNHLQKLPRWVFTVINLDRKKYVGHNFTSGNFHYLAADPFFDFLRDVAATTDCDRWRRFLFLAVHHTGIK